MLILGINFSHDSSVCILKDGKILAAIEEEKVSRIKQDFGWPRNAINRLFEEYRLNKKDVSIIAFDEEIPCALGKDEILYRFTKKSSKKNLEYINRITSYLNIGGRKIGEKSKSTIKEQIKSEGFTNAHITFYNHHLSHAASAYYAAPINANLIITSDGHGGKSSFNFYTPTERGLELLKENDYKASIGAFYSMVTKLLGFRPTRHEGKVTGLAAFGKPTDLVEKFDTLFRYRNNKLSRFPHDRLEEYWEQFGLEKMLKLSEKINLKESSDDISSDYARRSMVLLAWLEKETINYSKEDIAFACQAVAEKITLQEVKNVIQHYYKDQEVICALAGGVFANVRINQKIYELEEVKNIFIQPAMGDSGLALGNAILADIEFRSRDSYSRAYKFDHTFLGPDYSKDLKKYIANFGHENILSRKMANPSKEIANLLVENKIVGFWQGSMEWGPRALGRRSIILNTFDKTVNDTLNKRLNRTEFMPFAPVVLDTMAKTYFPNYSTEVPAAEYMTITYDTDERFHDILQATVHVDGTARPQIAYKDKTPLYYEILEEFYKITGCGALVNTSFNAHEEPILSSPDTAIRALQSNRIDFLVMEDYLFFLKQ